MIGLLLDRMDMLKSSKKAKEDTVYSVGLDIGASKICAVVMAQRHEELKPSIVGIGIMERKPVKSKQKKRIANLDQTSNEIWQAIKNAENQANIEIQEVNVGIPVNLVKFMDSRGIVSISSPNQKIDHSDVQRVLREAKNINLSPGWEIIHVLPQEYILNGVSEDIINPIGMKASKLEVLAKVVYVPVDELKNIEECLESKNLRVKNFVLEPLAIGKAVLNDNELELGVSLIDIGEMYTQVAIFYNGVLRYANGFEISGRHITMDIHQVLGIVQTQAEELKREFGHCHVPTLRDDKTIQLSVAKMFSPISISRSTLAEIIQARTEEIFKLGLEHLRMPKLKEAFQFGVVLTGGTMLLQGIEEVAYEQLGMAVRVGSPSSFRCEGLIQQANKPNYSTAVGLAIYGLEPEANEPNTSQSFTKQNGENKLVHKIVDFFKFF